MNAAEAIRYEMAFASESSWLTTRVLPTRPVTCQRSVFHNKSTRTTTSKRQVQEPATVLRLSLLLSPFFAPQQARVASGERPIFRVVELKESICGEGSGAVA
eukprot:scaffold314335_cov35-Tisochrysis_lutea.AAC.5